MAKPRPQGSGGSFEELVIAGLGRLSHDTIGRCLVGFIVLLCVWTFTVHWSVVFVATWQQNAALAVLTTGFHHALHSLLLYSLYKAVRTDPGFVSRPPGPNQGEPGQPDFCEKCGHRRPDRAHHCKVCKRCVKKMDHHCLFVNNCVGAHNYKFFVLLLLYTVLGGSYNAAISYYCLHIKQSHATNVLDFSSGMVMANGCTIGVIAIILLPFVSYHIYLASTNTTTLEALKSRTSSYDLGSPVRNLKHAFGNKPWLWLSPLHSGVDDLNAQPLLDTASLL